MEFYYILLCIGMAIAGVGMVMFFVFRGRNYSHTVEVEGVVNDCIEKPIVVEDEDGRMREGINNLTYFTYDIDGESYSTARYTKYKYEKGQTVKLKCNPDNMKDVVEAKVEGKDPKNIYSMCMVVGFFVLLAGLIAAYIQGALT